MRGRLEELSELKSRARGGQVSPDEVRALVAELQSTADPLAQDLLLQVIRYAARTRAYAPVVEPFLGSTHAHVVVTAINILCGTWRLTDRYAPQLYALMQGQHWDRDDWARGAAFGSAGMWLVMARLEDRPINPLLLRGIIEYMEDPETDVLSWNSGYSFLYQILNDPDLSAETVLPAAKARLAIEEARVRAAAAPPP